MPDRLLLPRPHLVVGLDLTEIEGGVSDLTALTLIGESGLGVSDEAAA
jgi:hypothetical protein